MTLLAIAQTALRQMGRYSVPATIVGNSDPTAVRCLALANLVGQTLATENRWQALLASYTFATVASTANYDLPDDFGRFANLSQWNRTYYAAMRGPVSPVEWQALQSSSVAVGSPFNQAFRIAGGFFSIYPTPTAVQTVAFDYWSTEWIANKTEFSDDSDEPLLDAGLITMGLRWMLLDQIGDDASTAKKLYDRRLESLQAADGGRDSVRFGDGSAGQFADNLPTTGFGV